MKKQHDKVPSKLPAFLNVLLFFVVFLVAIAFCVGRLRDQQQRLIPLTPET